MKHLDLNRRRRTVAGWLLLVLAAVFPVSAAGQSPPAGSTAVLVIKNGTLLTVSHGAIPRGSILIRDGKIAEVGTSVEVPPNSAVIDAAGQFVMPGIIDCHSHIAISGGVNEGSLAVTAMVGVEDVLDPADINIYRDLAGGVTTANILHGSANPIGGRCVVIKLRWGSDAKGLVFEGAKPGLKFALGENPKRSRGGPGAAPARYPQTRMGVEDVIREAFVETRNYMQRWDEYHRRIAAADRTVLPPRRDLKYETLAEVLRGERLVHAHAYRADEMLMFLRLADQFGFKVSTFDHALEGYKIAKELAAHGVGATVFSDWWAYKVEAYDAIPYNAALLTRKGVLVSVNSDSAEEARHLNQEAAKCMKYGGLNEQEALALITLNPARQLGIDRRVGSIDVGKDADLVIYNRHPLSVYASAQSVLIDGQVYFDVQKDRELRARADEERRSLKNRDRRMPDRERTPQGRPSPSVNGPTGYTIQEENN
jgi:imidazolonepropionase-like amidohydrolase